MRLRQDLGKDIARQIIFLFYLAGNGTEIFEQTRRPILLCIYRFY